jgi:hypothetical protein
MATAVGFLAFVPTDYTGVSDLGKIAGFGMLIALLLNLTLLPALLVLSRTKGEAHAVGFRWAAPIDHFLLTRRRLVIIGGIVLAVASAATLPWLRFDFNPLNLQSKNDEAVSTLFDLIGDPTSTPYTIEILEPSIDAANTIAKKIEGLSDVGQVITVDTFIPEDQDAKLAIIQDARSLLGPSLYPATIRPPSTDQAMLAATENFAKDVKPLAEKGDQAAMRLSKALDAVVARGAEALPALIQNLSSNAARRLDELRASLNPEKVTLANLPAELKDDWVTSDGRARIEVFPKGDMRDNTQLVSSTRFIQSRRKRPERQSRFRNRPRP